MSARLATLQSFISLAKMYSTLTVDSADYRMSMGFSKAVIRNKFKHGLYLERLMVYTQLSLRRQHMATTLPDKSSWHGLWSTSTSFFNEDVERHIRALARRLPNFTYRHRPSAFEAIRSSYIQSGRVTDAADIMVSIGLLPVIRVVSGLEPPQMQAAHKSSHY
ncbi:hypothetical protein CHS0354_029216 [Potamilus streckersoni]|uniref:Uncharacterized protein n=1 Tax=Potamilus streckersoni TaxID=2493646 RepID=A0AAE0W1S9_9BIVA|nr:hypothetical protein CHS0354_029216 [Potamilus streckersoni]